MSEPMTDGTMYELAARSYRDWIAELEAENARLRSLLRDTAVAFHRYEMNPHDQTARNQMREAIIKAEAAAAGELKRERLTNAVEDLRG